MSKVTTNFGEIGGRRMITFAVSDGGNVVPKTWAAKGYDIVEAQEYELTISDHEAFRRWKIARKAWRTRKLGKHQLQLPL